MEAQDVANALSESVGRLMKAQDPPWTQVELGRRLGWPQGNVSRMLAAKRGPTATTLAQLATVFGVDVCELLCGGEKPAGRSRGSKGKK